MGCVELDVSLFGVTQPKKGILIVKDACSPVMCAHKEKIPAVLGMNIIRECYVNLFNEHGTELFQIPQIRSATPAWKQALRCCQKRVGAGTVTMVPVTCPQVSGAVIEFLLELLAPEENALPEGLLLSPSLVYAERGLVYAPIVNVGSTEVWVAPRRIIGTVQVVKVVSAPGPK